MVNLSNKRKICSIKQLGRQRELHRDEPARERHRDETVNEDETNNSSCNWIWQENTLTFAVPQSEREEKTDAQLASDYIQLALSALDFSSHFIDLLHWIIKSSIIKLGACSALRRFEWVGGRFS